MGERLIIKNFGPIRNVDLDLHKFNVLIGENATGKSTVAKLLGVCRYFSYIIDNKIYLSENTSPFLQGLFSWGLQEFLKDNTYIEYECNDYSIIVRLEGAQFSLRNVNGTIPLKPSRICQINLKEKSPKFVNLLKELDKIRLISDNQVNEPDSNLSIPTSFFLNDVAKVMDNPFYLPTERGLQSIFSLGKNSIQNISDSLFNQFAELDHIARLFKSDTTIEPLDIVYKNVDGKGYIKKNNENSFYSLNSGASGYQSTIPIVLVVKYYTESNFNKKNKTFIIEEPELNLYPKTQQKLMEYLVDKITNYGNSILLTTHSPYILTSLNNLMYAWQVGQNNPEEVEKILTNEYWIDPADVSAYRLLPDGTCENIIDKDNDGNTLIIAEKIDEVSRDLNKKFDQLIDLEITNAREK